MKDFAKSIVCNKKVGNYGANLDAAGAKKVRELAAKHWNSGMHNSRDIAMAVAWELSKTSKAMQENKADLVSNIQDVVNRWIKEIKTGNETLHEYATSKPRVINEEKTGAEEFFKKLAKDVDEREKKDDADIEKIDNSLSDIFKKNKVIKMRKDSGEIVIIYSDGTAAEQQKEGSQMAKRGHNSQKEAVEYYKNKGYKIGNSAKDDKFAYVMREFNMGKLKTPDGKVVTDPAQAKAIAYSESKKTENGLARARKAMNAKNPQGLKLKIDDYAGQGLSYDDVVRQLIRFGYDKTEVETQKDYIRKKVQENL